MKKKLLVLCCLLYGAAIQASSAVEITDGSAAYMKSAVKALVCTQWNHATWDGGKTLQEHWKKDYDCFVQMADTAFVAGFNSAKKACQATVDGGEAQLKIDIAVVTVDYFFGGFSYKAGDRHKIWATVTVTDLASGAVVCIYEVDDFKGHAVPGNAVESYRRMWSDLGRKIARKK